MRAALCSFSLALLVAGWLPCGCGGANRSQEADRYRRLYRDLLSKYFDSSRVTGRKKHIPDEHAEEYVGLMIRDLETEPDSDEDWETFGAWRDAIEFLALRTTMPRDALPPPGTNDIHTFEGRDFSLRQVHPEPDVIKKYRRQIIAGAKEWLEARRGRLVFSTFGEGADPIIGFCSIEEQNLELDRIREKVGTGANAAE